MHNPALYKSHFFSLTFYTYFSPIYNPRTHLFITRLFLFASLLQPKIQAPILGNNMCMNSSELTPCSPLCIAFRNGKPLKGHKVNLRYRRLNRRRRLSKQAKKRREEAVKREMEIKNLKLYMENKSIIEENEKLRKKAFLLHQENQALLYQLQKKFTNPYRIILLTTKNSSH